MDNQHLHLLLLSGIQHGYPLPSQHPANMLQDGDNFERALAEAAKADTARALKNNRLILIDAGRTMLKAVYN